MIGNLFLLLVFLCCWLVLMVNGIIAMRTNSKLNKALKKRHPEIRRNLSVFETDFASPEIQAGAFSIFGVMLSFGSMNKSRDFWNSFVDVKAIADSEDIELKGLLNKSIRLTANFSKLLVVMVISLAFAAMFWPKG